MCGNKTSEKIGQRGIKTKKGRNKSGREQELEEECL